MMRTQINVSQVVLLANINELLLFPFQTIAQQADPLPQPTLPSRLRPRRQFQHAFPSFQQGELRLGAGNRRVGEFAGE